MLTFEFSPQNDWIALLSVAPALTFIVFVIASLSVGATFKFLFLVVASFLLYGIYQAFVLSARRILIAYAGFHICQVIGILVAIKFLSSN